jgi:hypothetical protein
VSVANLHSVYGTHSADANHDEHISYKETGVRENDNVRFLTYLFQFASDFLMNTFKTNLPNGVEICCLLSAARLQDGIGNGSRSPMETSPYSD